MGAMKRLAVVLPLFAATGPSIARIPRAVARPAGARMGRPLSLGIGQEGLARRRGRSSRQGGCHDDSCTAGGISLSANGERGIMLLKRKESLS